MASSKKRPPRKRRGDTKTKASVESSVLITATDKINVRSTKSAHALESRRWVVLSFFLPAVLLFLPSKHDDAVAPPHVLLHNDIGFVELIDWMVKERGCTVDERVTAGMDQESGSRGLFALDSIAAEEVLWSCPYSIVLGHGHESDGCSIPRLLEQEIHRGAESEWWPYLKYVGTANERYPMDFVPETLIAELQGLPPYDRFRHTQWFEGCKQSLKGVPLRDWSAVERHSAAMIVTRIASLGTRTRGMFPLYDLMNHDLAKMNTKMRTGADSVQIIASLPIAKHEQLWNIYRYDAHELWWDYGFLPKWPQFWVWKDPPSGEDHRFTYVAEDAVIITPPGMAQPPEYFARGKTLVQWRKMAKDGIGRQSRSEEGRAILEGFISAASRLLASLPTTEDEDAEIEVRLRNEEGDDARDRASIIAYRRELKRAVRKALSLTVDALREGNRKVKRV